MAAPELAGPALGAVCALVSAVAWTLTGAAAGRCRRTWNALAINMRPGGAAAAGRGGVLTALSAVAWIVGLKYAGITVTTVLSSTSPLFAIPIGLVAFRERVGGRAIAGAALCLGGIALISR